MQRWRSANKERLREYDQNQKLLATYGISLDQKRERIAKQEGRCAICGTDQPGGRWNSFCTDHDHTTNELRGELCHSCNAAIGLFSDSAATLQAAVAYLERYKTCPQQ